MFTQREVRFLSAEHATLGLRELPYIPEETLKTNKERSLRTIQGMLERRAAVLGKTFAEFRNSQSNNQPVDLETQVAGAKLF